MTKRQFMEELRSSLEGMVSQAVIQENMNYYEDYINEQIRNGKNEQDVLNELGSPRLIARSIIDAKGEDDVPSFSMLMPPKWLLAVTAVSAVLMLVTNPMRSLYLQSKTNTY